MLWHRRKICGKQNTARKFLITRNCLFEAVPLHQSGHWRLSPQDGKRAVCCSKTNRELYIFHLQILCFIYYIPFVRIVPIFKIYALHICANWKYIMEGIKTIQKVPITINSWESCSSKVVGSIPLICMSKCPWARYWTLNCSWCCWSTPYMAAPAISVWVFDELLYVMLDKSVC